VPLYAGIERLEKKGDQVQWGGRTLYEDGRFATSDGQAHFSVVRPIGRRGPEFAGSASARADGAARFFVSTRRGKQFNSMVQRDVDPLTGARRDDVLISEADLARLSLREGDLVELTSADGAFRGRLRPAAITPGNLEVHWPEGNALLSASAIDPESLEPDYNAVVTLTAVPA
jgi:anaerobic selenocysteine-containing dehydrogenase